jgi:hypothetical protein
LGFALEAITQFISVGQMSWKNFNGDDAAKPRFPGKLTEHKSSVRRT